MPQSPLRYCWTSLSNKIPIWGSNNRRDWNLQLCSETRLSKHLSVCMCAHVAKCSLTYSMRSRVCVCVCVHKEEGGCVCIAITTMRAQLITVQMTPEGSSTQERRSSDALNLPFCQGAVCWQRAGLHFPFLDGFLSRNCVRRKISQHPLILGPGSQKKGIH